MERLTYDFCFNGSHSNQVKGADNLVCSEVCEREGSCKECPIARAFDRLAAIEDILGDDYDLDRLRELIQADREGRCLVLACMPGESVFVVVSVPESGIYAVVETKPQGLHEILTFTRSLGKTVFRTREEAEAALAKMREEGCE